MRPTAALLVAAAFAACGGSPSELDGSWYGQTESVVVFELSLSESAGRVDGTGTYDNDNRPGPTQFFSVRGTFSDPQVTLSFATDLGPFVVFEGTLETATGRSRLVGNLINTTSSGDVQSFAITFLRE
jgi:hypothetical protein